METEKKYLKTIEEVSDALAAGKVVYAPNGDSYKKDRNGFIVSKDAKGDLMYLNCTISKAYDFYLYTLEPKPLEVKLWHLYKDKSGNKVFIINENKNKSKFYFSGYCEKYSGLMDYSKTGEVWASKEYNLVKELADLSKYFEKEDNNAKND